MIDQLRHLETAAARFGKIGFVGPTEARRLVEWSMGERIVVLSRMPRNVSDWDLRCPLAALARTLGPQAAHAHAGRPFLRVTATAARHWRDRLAAAAQHGFCVGLAGWEAFDDAGTGRTDSSPHVSRPSSLSSLAPLLRVPGVSWVPLGCPGDDASSAMPPQSVDWIDWRADCDDLADEASLIDNLDLVIALDSAHGHLADGLGVPVWRLDAARITASQREGGGDTPFSPQRRATIDALSRFPLPCVADDWPGAVGAAADVLLAMATEFQGWTR
ncbi:glycosyltransferase family 9 protein [Pandoraea anhela]|nr:glycosyltransferase family 9 protein [Pandoraea anhela]